MNKHLFFIFIIFFTSVFQISLQANTPRPVAGSKTIKGSLVDSLTNEPIELANCILFSSRDSSVTAGTTSDINGVFSFSHNSDDNLFLKISFIGYKSKIIQIPAGGTPELNLGILELSPAKVSLHEVHVTAEKERIIFEDDKIIFNVDKDIASLGGSAVEVLENAPMVAVDFEGNVSIIGKMNTTSIYIDGIPQKNSGLDSKDILKTISSRDIEKVEIIENPGSKYGSETSGGVINIILKKNDNSSLNASVDINANTKNSFSPSVSFSMMERKYSLRGSIFSSYSENKMHTALSRQTTFNGSSAVLDQDRNNKSKSFSNNFSLSFLYNLNANNSLTASASFRKINSDINGSFTNNFPSDNDISPAIFYNSSTRNNDGDYYWTAAEYRGLYDTAGQQLYVHFDYRRNIYNSGLSSSETDLTPGTDDEYLKNNSGNTNNEYHFNSTYLLPFNSDHAIEATMLFSSENISMNNDYFALKDNTWQELLSSKIAYKYNEKRYSANVNYTGKILDIKYTLDPGIDYVKVQGGDFGENLNYTFTEFFPMVAVSKRLSKEHIIRLGYQRRIRYPLNRQLNPRKDFSDSLDIIMGNPDLKPEVSDISQLEYNYNAVNTILGISFSYDRNSDIIENFTYPVSSTTTITTYKNLGENSRYNIRASADQSFSRWLRFNSVLNVMKIDYSHSLYSQDKFFYSLYANASLSLNGYFFQSKLVYRSSSSTAQSKSDGSYFVDIAAKKSILDNQLTFYFRVKDLFNSIKNNSRIYGNGLYSYSSSNQTTRIFMAGITYYFQATKETSNIKDEPSDEGVDDF